LTFAILVGEKMKGNDMEKAKAVSKAKAKAAAKSVTAETKAIATKGKSYTRKVAGQGLLVLAAMGSSMTAGVAGQQLSKGRASGCGPFLVCKP
jgi:hypothetical protein